MPAFEPDKPDTSLGATDPSVTTQAYKGARPARRSVLQTAAWAVPLVAVAVATPLAAASGARGAIVFSPSSVIAASGAQQRGVAGTVTPATDAVVLAMTYSAGFGGPRFVTTTAGTGVFSLAIRCPVGSGVTGVASASAADFSPGTISLRTSLPQDNTGTVSFTYDQAAGVAATGGGWSFADLTGSVSVTAGNLLPSGVELEYPAGLTGPASASVIPQPGSTTLGTFAVSGVAAADGTDTPAVLKAAPSDFQGIVAYAPTAAEITLTL